MFITLKPITREGGDVVAKHGSLWFVKEEADQVRFSPNRGPWLLIQSRDDTRWVHQEHDSNFIVQPYGLDLSEADAQNLTGELTRSEPIPREVTKMGFRAPTRAVAIGAISIGAIFVAGLALVHVPERYAAFVLLSAIAVFAGLFQLGRVSETSSAIRNAEDSVRHKVLEKMVLMYQKHVDSLYTRDQQGRNIISIDSHLFIAMRDIVREVYKSADLLDDDTAFMLRESILHDSEWIAGTPMDRLQGWLNTWHTVCLGSIEKLERIKAVHLCEHDSLYLDDGRLMRRHGGDWRDTCSEFRNSFPLRAPNQRSRRRPRPEGA